MAGLLGANLNTENSTKYYQDINQLSVRSYTELLAEERSMDKDFEEGTGNGSTRNHLSPSDNIQELNELSVRSYTELLPTERSAPGTSDGVKGIRYSYHGSENWESISTDNDRDTESGHHHHRRHENKKINARFESVNYDVIENDPYLRDEQASGYKGVIKKNLAKWLVMFLIGVFTGVIAACIGITVEQLVSLKVAVLIKYINKCVDNDCLYIPFFIWLSMNIVGVLIAGALVVFGSPVAAGSGIPQIKCYLNGVKIPNVVAMKTLVCKAVGVAMSMSAGLAVGKEGPMIHSGSVVAAGISQARSRRFKSLDFKLFKYFRCDTEKRDFISGGAAAGVASAFGAPVGGVLFTLEEGASFWNQNLTWRIFFCSMVSTFSVNVILSAVHGHPGDLNYPGLISFGRFSNLKYDWYELLVFILMGIMGGLTGALFNFINRRITILRQRFINNRLSKMLEVVVVCTVTTIVAFMLIYFTNDCHSMKILNSTYDVETEKYQVQLRCKDGDYNSMASLFFETPEGSVRRLFHDNSGAYNPVSLSLFFICYFFLACWTYGLPVPSGIFIPSLLTGAAWGRLIGMLVNSMVDDTNIDVGKYALIGAAAQLGGILRMTISLTVILIEATGNMSFGLPVMLVLMMAQWVGNMFNKGLYDIHISLNGVPYLGWEAPPMSAKIFAREVMCAPVITLHTVEKVGDVVDLLTREIHNGFPVVDELEEDEQLEGNHGRLKGLILREQLSVLLRHKVFLKVDDMNNIPQHLVDEVSQKLTLTDFRDAYPRYPHIEDIVITPEEREMVIVLTPFMNPSPYSVVETASLPRIFRLFRALGLSYLIVTDSENKCIGMVTRKDLARYSLNVRWNCSVSLDELEVRRS